MNISIDVINKRSLVVNGKSYPLDRLEDFILKYWTPLATANFTKAIESEGQTKFTYDWSKIFSIAKEGGIIIAEFIEREGGFTSGKLYSQPDLFNN